MEDLRGRIMVGIDGMEPTAEERDRLRSPLVGGCILFGAGFSSADGIARLADAAREAAGREILVATDQEGGRVQRFRGGGITRLPPMGRVGEAYRRDPAEGTRLAFDCGLLMAAELRHRGVDLSFAPVLDLDHGRSGVIGDRAFSRSPAAVAALGAAFADGMRRAGMRAVGKHFPGHGYCAQDSHVEYPVDPRPLDAISRDDLDPYRTSSGVSPDAVMTAHVRYPGVDDGIATYSARWLGGVLRGELGFGGRVISDDLCMAGASGAGAAPDRVRAAVGAGCDLVLVCHGWDRSESERALGFSDSGPNPWLDLAPVGAPPDLSGLGGARARVAAA